MFAQFIATLAGIVCIAGLVFGLQAAKAVAGNPAAKAAVLVISWIMNFAVPVGILVFWPANTVALTIASLWVLLAAHSAFGNFVQCKETQAI